MQYLKIEGRMTKIRDLVHKLRIEYRTESVIADQSRTGEFNRFSVESKRPSKSWEISSYTALSEYV